MKAVNQGQYWCQSHLKNKAHRGDKKSGYQSFALFDVNEKGFVPNIVFVQLLSA